MKVICQNENAELTKSCKWSAKITQTPTKPSNNPMSAFPGKKFFGGKMAMMTNHNGYVTPIWHLIRLEYNSWPNG